MNIRKIAILLCTMLMLTGCARLTKDSTKEQIYNTMDRAVVEAINEQTTTYQNLTKKYYSYYLSDNVGRRNATEASEELVCENRSVLMSLNASAVVSTKYYSSTVIYDDTVIDKDALFSKTYTAVDFTGSVTHLLVNVYKMNNDYYLLIRSRYFVYLSRASLAEMPNLAKEIIRVARTTTVNEPEVIAAYSSKEVINYNQVQMSVFSQNVPVNGTLEEMLGDYFREYDFDNYGDEYSEEDYEIEY